MDSATEKKHRRNRNCLIVSSLGIMIGIVSGIGIQSRLDQSNFDAAENAYRNADCKTALQNLDSIINRWRITDFYDLLPRVRARQTECQTFQAGVQQQEARKFGEALMTYSQFQKRFPNSALVSQTQQQTKIVFEQQEPTAIAHPNFCQQIDQLQSSIPQQNRASIYYACANGFVKQSNYSAAIRLFERILKEFPQHPFASQAKAAMAKAIVAEARNSGAKNIPPPAQVSQVAPPGTAMLSITNDSPRKIQLVFSGPQPYIEEIEACQDCQIYQQRPESCPERGAPQEFTLQPGEYDVVVRPMDTLDVKPFAGKWALADGSGYGHCFFIVQQPN